MELLLASSMNSEGTYIPEILKVYNKIFIFMCYVLVLIYYIWNIYREQGECLLTIYTVN